MLFPPPSCIINTYFLPTDEEETQSDQLSSKWLYCRHPKLDKMRPIFLSGMFQHCWLKSLALAGTSSACLSEIVLWWPNIFTAVSSVNICSKAATSFQSEMLHIIQDGINVWKHQLEFSTFLVETVPLCTGQDSKLY